MGIALTDLVGVAHFNESIKKSLEIIKNKDAQTSDESLNIMEAFTKL